MHVAFVLCTFNFALYHFIGNDGRVKCDKNGDEEEFVITFEEILAFTTGLPCEPPLGFDPPPKLCFQADSPYPQANTCTNTLYLPIHLAKELALESFMYYICYGILNTAGFGRI